jgi:hypothetical protein
VGEAQRRLSAQRVIKEGPWHEGYDVNNMWMKMTTSIRKVLLDKLRLIREVGMKLRWHGGGIRMCRMLLKKERVIYLYTSWIGLHIT